MNDNKLYAIAWLAIAIMVVAMASCQGAAEYARAKYSTVKCSE
jgi:hypothetical protein